MRRRCAPQSPARTADRGVGTTRKSAAISWWPDWRGTSASSRRWPSAAARYLATVDCATGEPELQQLAVQARSAPEGIRLRHGADQCAHVGLDRRPTRLQHHQLVTKREHLQLQIDSAAKDRTERQKDGDQGRHRRTELIEGAKNLNKSTPTDFSVGTGASTPTPCGRTAH